MYTSVLHCCTVCLSHFKSAWYCNEYIMQDIHYTTVCTVHSAHTHILQDIAMSICNAVCAGECTGYAMHDIARQDMQCMILQCTQCTEQSAPTTLSLPVCQYLKQGGHHINAGHNLLSWVCQIAFASEGNFPAEQIVHISWGLNCIKTTKALKIKYWPDPPAFVHPTPKLRDIEPNKKKWTKRASKKISNIGQCCHTGARKR